MIFRAAPQVAWELNSCIATPVLGIGAMLDVGLVEIKKTIRTYILAPNVVLGAIELLGRI